MLYTRLSFVAGLLTLVVLTGCTTYVNIPAMTGDVAVHDPNDATVRHVLTASLQAVLMDQPIDSRFQVLLPAGIKVENAHDIVAPLGNNAQWIADDQPALDRPAVLDAHQVRVRGWLAQVDVIRPRDARQPQGLRQLVTVDLRWDFVYGWHMTRLRAWNSNVEDALKASAYTEIQAEGVRPTSQVPHGNMPDVGPGLATPPYAQPEPAPKPPAPEPRPSRAPIELP